MAESSRSLSRNKKKVKHSKLAAAATNKTTFKYEQKKEYPFITSVPVRDIIGTAHYINFCDVIKCAVFQLNMKFVRYY